jgi:ribose transport system ATP-binding protein
MDDVILALEKISKLYPGVKALDQVSVSFKAGEIHSIVGENGAGKSTMIKTITGAMTPTSGKIIFKGVELKAMNPIFAMQQGIGAVYQEFNLIPSLTVAENIFYGRELRGNFFLKRKEMNRLAKEILNDLGVQISPKTIVKDLSVGYQQIVEIAKSVSRDVKFLIMDEPTAPLTDSEVEKLYKIVFRLKQKGVTILYISHKLEEVFRLSDRITVMRDGKYVVTLPCAETNREQLISLMVGRELGQNYPGRSTKNAGKNVLEVKHLSNGNIHDVSFTLRKGEILGIAGLVGAGRTELVRAIFGADRILRGNVYINGREVFIKNPQKAIKNGIGLIPEDRKQHGVLLEMDIRFNVSYASLDHMTQYGFVNRGKETSLAGNYIESLRIKTPGSSQQVKNLSGGNQQKVVLAKWLATHCDILFFDEPTRGIDIGAKQEIYQLMRQLAEEGKSMIMISSEMPELIGMSDRVLVMKEGRLTGELQQEQMTQEKILTLATGTRMEREREVSNGR